MNDLDQTIRQMDLHFFATGQHGASLAMAADCLSSSKECVFLDVRTEEETRYSRFGRNVIHIPFQQLPDRLGEIPADRMVIVFCTSIFRASMAVLYLKAAGFPATRTLMANSEEIVRLFSPAETCRHMAPATNTTNNCCM